MCEKSEQSGNILRIDQIVELAAQGYIDKEIAAELGTRTSTVITHWKRLRAKLGVTNRTAAVMKYLQNKIEQQNQQLREAHTELERYHSDSQGAMSSLLSGSQRRVIELEARLQQVDFLDRASSVAHAAAYELKSVEPVCYRYLSASAAQFDMNVKALYSGPICQDTEGTIFKLGSAPSGGIFFAER